MSGELKELNTSDLTITKRLLTEIRPERKLFALSLVFYAPILLAQLAQPLIIGQAVDKGYRAMSLDAVTLWAGLYLLAVAAQTGIEMLQLYVMQMMGQRSVRALRARLFAKIQRLPMSYFDTMPLGRVMTRVTNDVESLSELFSSGAVRIVGDILFLVGTLVMLFTVDVQLTLRTIMILPVLVIGVMLFRVRAKTAFRRVRNLLSKLNAYLQEHLSGMHIVQLFGQEKRIRQNFEKDNMGYMVANREAIAIDAGVYAFVDAMSHVTVAVVLLYGAAMQEEGALTLGVLVAFVEALGRFFFPIRELSNKYTVIQSAFASAERIYELEDEDETVAQKPDAKPPVFERALTFEDVRFSYPTGDEVIRGVSFTINKGERVALVGHTGSGKSTLVKLATRTYDVQHGRIALDGVDLRDLELHGTRKLFCAVPQDVFLFSGTLAQNLTFGREDVSRERLMEAVKACQAEPILERHGGLDAEVTERGQNFSLGERQLIALVRALCTDPPILILDEATASVDRQTERTLQAATEKLMDGRTALIVAHRLSTIEHCDRICVMHQGRLVEEGSHQELMQRGGRYAKLVELQQKEGG